MKKRASLIALMLLAIVAIAGLAFWDEQRESAAALEDFAQDQAMLADSVGEELSMQVAGDAQQRRRIALSVLERYSSFEARRRGSVLLLVAPPGSASWSAADGRTLVADELTRAFDVGSTLRWLTREEAANLGLPPRIAAAGFAKADEGQFGGWRVAVIMSAERVRDRQRRASLRLILGVVLAGGLVFAFGSLALRKQRRELALEHDLALADLQRERDARLAAVSRATTMGTLAMGIAHEVGTPLGIIAGRADQILPRVSGDERSTRGVQAIVEQAERIRRVIRGFLDLARGGAPEFCAADPAVVIEQALSLVEHRFAKAGVRLSAVAAPDLPPIRCDLPMLQQALLNLLLNACDACERGGCVEVRALSDSERISFIVTDDGAGIAPEAAARATEPFFTTKAAGKGTGLGLAISSEIVKMHRGSLEIGPAGARGTRASIHLPRPKVETDAAA